MSDDALAILIIVGLFTYGAAIMWLYMRQIKRDFEEKE